METLLKKASAESFLEGIPGGGWLGGGPYESSAIALYGTNRLIS